MKRIHNCSQELILNNRARVQNNIRFKPSGLWYGINDSWINWCKQEMPEWIGSYFYEIDINLDKILVINNDQDLIEFHNKYKISLLDSLNKINWERVSDEYNGIEINKYYSRFRLEIDYMWYCGWDCASGCIWDASCVKNVIKVDQGEIYG